MSVEPRVLYGDELGPEKILYIYDPRTKLKGILVVDNVARGPAIGGIRMSLDLTTEEVFRLARAMSLKNSLAEIRHGGAKSGIVADPKSPKKYDLIRAFAKAVKPITDYIPGPDMGTDEKCMAVVYDEIGRAVGLPKEMGGIPLDEVGITGYGVAVSTEATFEYLRKDLAGSTVAVEGFGAVGRATVRFLAEKGAKIVAVSDSKGTVYNPKGIDYERLMGVKLATGSVINYKDGEKLGTEDLFKLEVDVLIPGARPDVINTGNVNDVRAKLIVEAANIPATFEAERVLHKRNILVIPDIVANAGGVIAAAVEYRGGSEEEAFELVKSKIGKNVKFILDSVYNQGLLPREASEKVAKERIVKSMEYRSLPEKQTSNGL
ncbi:MAG: Glu/Leu/Phe/Val dehydrogenase [Nitrososphaerota archaeon]